jgi:hypothetical protein
MIRGSTAIAARTVLVMGIAVIAARAHDGPPSQIVSERVVGAYEISVWADADATDDGAAGGQFWVVVEPADTAVSIPASTSAHVSVQPLGRAGPVREARAEPVGANAFPQLAALVLDHEGKYRVQVSIAGPLGPARVETEIEATYNLRPAPFMIVVYAMPFLLAGALWLKLLLRRRSRPRTQTEF